MINKCVFLDRDGVINVDRGYISKIEDVVIYDFVYESLMRLKSYGFKLIIITNQSGIGRGYYTENDFFNVNMYILSKLRQYGIIIDDVFYCPHYYEKCSCRKPNNGMIEQAILKHYIDRNRSWMIGDKETDIKCGIKSGLRTILTLTGNGEKFLLNTKASYVCCDLSYATDKILLSTKW